MRPSRRHANVVKSRARYGHDEDQLARALGITRETMRGWAKKDAQFARALQEALQISRDYWEENDRYVRERDEWDRQIAANERKHAHLDHRKPKFPVAAPYVADHEPETHGKRLRSAT